MSLKVLLADDSMTAQNMGKKILAESGYDVTTVSNGAAAVKKIAEVKPDVVILDIYMPGYTGLEVCERVRANMDTANLPVLLTVGKMEPYRAEDGAKVRADGVIVKPFEATDLLAVVKKMTEKAVPAARHAASRPEPETATEEEVAESAAEPAMPTAVEVPSEMAAAPALAMEEFDAAPAHVDEFKPAIEWAAAPELPVEQSSTLGVPDQQNSEIPWSFDEAPDQSAIPLESQAKSTPPAQEPDSEVEFTSAPRAGEVEVQQAEGLEAGLEAPPTGALEITTDPGLTSPLEMTDFATSFKERTDSSEPEDAVIAELPTIETPADSAWDGWAHAQPETTPEIALGTTPEAAVENTVDSSWTSPPAAEESSHLVEQGMPQVKPIIDDFEAKVAAAMAGFGVEPVADHKTEPIAVSGEATAPETLTSPNVDDFEARVAQAMSGFATEPVEAKAEAQEEAHAQPAEIEAVADDFEARVAAAMAGFSTEPAEPEPVPEPIAEDGIAAEEPRVEATPEPPAAHDDFDARLAQALSAFDSAPEITSPEENSAISPAEPAVEMRREPPPVQLNETTLLPHEATLSLEEEMKQALALHASEPAPEPEPAPENVSASEPQASRELDLAHAAQEPGPPELPEVAVAAFAAAASADSVEPAPANSQKFADAVQRAIERLKPQLVAEIVKELKGE
ncbi:MAG TPA: response regulator [Terriglobales bacterium]|nr:response regulator [Terriglobales bacterium]